MCSNYSDRVLLKFIILKTAIAIPHKLYCNNCKEQNHKTLWYAAGGLNDLQVQ